MGRVLALCCFLHQKNPLGYIWDTSCTISVTLRVFTSLRLRSSGCTCPLFIKMDSSVHIMSLFLWLLPVVGQCQTGGYPSLSAVMVLGKVTLAQRKASSGSFRAVAVAVELSHLCCYNFFAVQQLWRCGFCFMQSQALESVFLRKCSSCCHTVCPHQCVHPSLPILVTAEHIGQLLPSLQTSTNLWDHVILWILGKVQLGKK